MNHPDLEKQLKNLYSDKKKAVEEFVDIAAEAQDICDKAGRTQMVIQEDLKNGKKKRSGSSKFFRLKRKKKETSQ